MTPEEYRQERKRRGTQAAIAGKLEVSRVTIARRESGKIPVTREAWLALRTIKVTR
jgi:DNA-binding XRE family transcriptional regulator